MSRSNTEYNKTLEALMVSRSVVLSLLGQIGMHSFKEKELAEIVRRCALDLLGQKPAIAIAIQPPIKARRQRRTAKKSRSKISRG